MGESLGKLGELKEYTAFTFNNNIVYMVLSNVEGNVSYRRIHRYQKNNKSAFDWNDQNYKSESNPMRIVYFGNENKEVFDFLPF